MSRGSRATAAPSASSPARESRRDAVGLLRRDPRGRRAVADAARADVRRLGPAGAIGRGLGPYGVQAAIAAEPAWEGYHLLSSVRGDLLEKLGRHAEARAEFERAAAITRNGRERELLLERAAGCGPA